MKMLYVLFAVAFLVFQVHATPKPTAKDEAVENLNTLKEDPGLKPQPDDEARLSVVLCNGIDGYCLPRGYACHNDLVYKEYLNNCPFSAFLKCCVR